MNSGGFIALLFFAESKSFFLSFNGINIGAGKDKARGKGSFSQARTRKEDLAEDTETEKQEESLLTECKCSLSSIFVHWEPAFPLADPPPAPPGDKVDPSLLAVDTAHLLAKWSLRCLVEASYDGNRTRSFVLWVDNVMMKHRAIVDLLLQDPGVKADLLRLYHQACETQCHSPSANMETFQLFTNVMIHSLESQGRLPERHQAVVSACLTGVPHDQSRCGETLHSQCSCHCNS